MNNKHLANYAIGGVAVLLALYAYKKYYSPTHKPRLYIINQVIVLLQQLQLIQVKILVI